MTWRLLHRRLVVHVLRAPAVLYDFHAGWILGRRFLRLTHVGRRTGRRHRMMLEVVADNPRTQELIVVAGLGRSAHWYRNLVAAGTVEVAIGRDRFVAGYRELSPIEAAAVFAAYERRNRFITPVIRRVLTGLLGWHYDGTPSGRLKLAGELPMVALRPRYPGLYR